LGRNFGAAPRERAKPPYPLRNAGPCAKLTSLLRRLIPQATQQSIESALVAAAVMVVLTGFACVLAWAERETRELRNG
jgi:hypothetical protein